jgi:Ca2+-binding EF-hand superfamily protein
LPDNKRQLRGFNEMDKNNDGKLSRAEAARNRELLSKWNELDRDNDGSLSRTEYLREMARQDTNKVKERASGATQSTKGSASDNAATGSIAPQSQRK